MATVSMPERTSTRCPARIIRAGTEQGDPANVMAWRNALGPAANGSPDRHQLGASLIQVAESRCEQLGEVHRRQLTGALTKFRDEVRELLAANPAA